MTPLGHLIILVCGLTSAALMTFVVMIWASSTRAPKALKVACVSVVLTLVFFGMIILGEVVNDLTM